MRKMLLVWLSFSVLAHNTDGEQHCWQGLNFIPTGRLEESTWTSSDYLDVTVVDDLKSHNLTLTEAVNMAQNQPLLRQLTMSEHGSKPATLEPVDWVNTAQNQPLWRLLATSGTAHTATVQARNDDDDDDVDDDAHLQLTTVD